MMVNIQLFKGFEKVFVKAGETKKVSIVDEHFLSYYSVSNKKFIKHSGIFTVFI